jgi:hypothetical protein
MSVFDGLADIFTDTFGEAVIYTPVATGISKTINAIWWQSSLDPLDCLAAMRWSMSMCARPSYPFARQIFPIPRKATPRSARAMAL